MTALRFRGGLAALSAATALAAICALGVVLPPSPPTDGPRPLAPAVERDLAEIRASGTLRVAMVPDDLSYTVYRGQFEGLGWEMATGFARELGVRLEVRVPRSPAAALGDVSDGLADLAVFVDPGPRPVLREIAWSREFETAHAVAVGRRAEGILRVEDLRGKTLAVRRHSALEGAAVAWRERLGGELRILRLAPEISDRRLARLAAERVVPLALMDQHRARLEVAFYQPLEISAPLGSALPIRWALRPNAPELRRTLSSWLETQVGTGRLAARQQRYFENPLRLRSRRRPPFRAAGESLSPYDAVFRRAADRHGLDWRLLAALSFAESGYDRWEISSKGAMGLLQIMPAIAREYGAADPFDPEQNVAAGAALLSWLHGIFDEVPEPDRLRFTLAAYNMGIGHVQDARALAALRGLHPDRWHGGIADVLHLMEDPVIGSKLPHGQARGTVTLRYVEHVTKLLGTFTGEVFANAPRPTAASKSEAETPGLKPREPLTAVP